MLSFLVKAIVVVVGFMLAGGFSVLLYGVYLRLKGERLDVSNVPTFVPTWADKMHKHAEDTKGKHPAEILEDLHRQHQNCKCEPIQQRGKIHFTLHGVRNPVIVETFFRKFDEAAVATSHCQEFYSGEVQLTFEVKGCTISENLKRDFEKAGFCVDNIK